MKACHLKDAVEVQVPWKIVLQEVTFSGFQNLNNCECWQSVQLLKDSISLETTA